MWGVGFAGTCYSKTFSVLLTFRAQFVQLNLKFFCVSLPFPSATSAAEYGLSLFPEFPVTITHDQVIKIWYYLNRNDFHLGVMNTYCTPIAWIWAMHNFCINYIITV